MTTLQRILSELRADHARWRLTEVHAWLRYRGGSEKLHPTQRAELLRAAQAIVSQLEGRNP